MWYNLLVWWIITVIVLIIIAQSIRWEYSRWVMGKFKGIKQYTSPLGHKQHRSGTQKKIDKLAKEGKVNLEMQELLEKIRRVSENTPMDILDAIMSWLPKAELNETDRAAADQIMEQYKEWQESSKIPLKDELVDPLVNMTNSIEIRELLMGLATPIQYPAPQPQYPAPQPPGLFVPPDRPNTPKVPASSINWNLMGKIIWERTSLGKSFHYGPSISVLTPILKVMGIPVSVDFLINKHFKIAPSSMTNISDAKNEEDRRINVAKTMHSLVSDMSSYESKMLETFLYEIIVKGQ